MTRRAFILPIIILILIILSIFYENLHLELKTPSNGWSRSSSLGISTEKKMIPFNINEDKVSTTYIPANKIIYKVTCSQLLDCKTSKDINVNVPENTAFWMNNKRVIYLDRGVIYLVNGSDKRKIADNVTSIVTNQNRILYWVDRHLFELDPMSEQIRSLYKFNYNITEVAFYRDSFIITTEPQQENLLYTYFEHTGEGYKITQFPTFSLSYNESLQGLKVQRQDNRLHIYMNILTNSQGNKIYTVKEVILNVENPEIRPITNKLNFIDYRNNQEYNNPRSISLVGKNYNKILFTAYGSRVSKYQGYNLYLAEKKGKNWIAKRVSTTKNLPINPFGINGEGILWLSFSGEDYSLYGASPKAGVVAESKKVRTADVKNAIYNTITNSFGSITIFFFSILWIILPCVFFAYIFFSKNNLLEKENTKWLVYVPMALYLVSQIYTFNTSFRIDSYIYAPAYLTFHGSFVIIPTVLFLVSSCILKFSKLCDISPAGKFVYFAITNILFITLLIGSYVL
ncbi:hypothetical protein V1498_07005 [Peribacillus sp. SCS-26]|uniref:hypothetical protein n=1 Tax=Paraperibacillus marinus TaxID=3115295 RepID=UPI0039069E10